MKAKPPASPPQDPSGQPSPSSESSPEQAPPWYLRMLDWFRQKRPAMLTISVVLFLIWLSVLAYLAFAG